MQTWQPKTWPTTAFNSKLYRGIFISIAVGSLFISPQVALVAGMAVAIAGNPFIAHSKKLTSKILGWCIVGMGAGMNLLTVIEAGAHGIAYTMAGILGTLAVGHCLAKLLKTDQETSLLVTVGTAICGGSAIVALASAIRAKDSSISISLATVFLLNACALMLFPLIGHALDLSQTQFGYWSALAIHDTSSVVGATLAYGAEANLIGTSVKLARALWIIPVTFFLARLLKANDKTSTKPSFILGFLASAALVSFVPTLKPLGELIAQAAKHGLSLALFLIGAGLSKDSLKAVGFKPLLFAMILWFLVASVSLLAIFNGLVE